MAAKEGLPQDELGLTFMGKIVKPSHSLADLGASKWSTLTVSLGIMGGEQDEPAFDDDEVMDTIVIDDGDDQQTTAGEHLPQPCAHGLWPEL